MRIVVLRETWWAGVANENPLKPSWGASLGAVRTVFWLGGRKGSGKGGAFRKQIVFCDDFMTHFLSEFLYTVLSCATVVEVMAWASPASIFGFGGAQEASFLQLQRTGFPGGVLQNKFSNSLRLYPVCSSSPFAFGECRCLNPVGNWP